MRLIPHLTIGLWTSLLGRSAEANGLDAHRTSEPDSLFKAPLSATESLQLVVAVASLASGGGGFDPVAEVRKAVSIDTLRVDAGEDGVPTVEAGKYLTKDICVGVRQGGGKAAGSVVVESGSKQDGSQKVGARLK